MDKTKVIILGGGIGGLSAAHELSKNNNFEILVVERNNYLGGQASEKKTKSNNLHTAVCWRAISSNYKYFLDILDEIVDDDFNKVITRLKPLNVYLDIFNSRGNNKHVEYGNAFVTGNFKNILIRLSLSNKRIPKRDIRKLLYIYFYANCLSKEHLYQYDKILWKDYIKNISPEITLWICESLGVYLSMDYSKLSVYTVFEMMRKQKTDSKLDASDKFYTFDGSMSDVLFDPWRKYLETKNVNFLLCSEVTNIHRITGLSTISTISIVDVNGVEKKYNADIFINAMDMKNLKNLYPSYEIYTTVSKLETYGMQKMVSEYANENYASIQKQLLEYETLYNNSYQEQRQITYYLPQSSGYIKLPHPSILVLPDSEWFLMIRTDDKISDTIGKITISCCIGVWDKPGINKKTALKCNKYELAEECLQQLMRYQDTLKIYLKIPKVDIFGDDTFELDTIKGTIQEYEPKYSNNINTLNIRPYYNDNYILNLYHATSYTRTNMNLYNMESAAEAGVKVAKLIINKMKKLENINARSSNNLLDLLNDANIDNINNQEKQIKWYYRFFRSVDKKIYKICNMFKLNKSR